ncbi:hypothetical protein GCM10023078_05220 [Gibbsiella greigii]
MLGIEKSGQHCITTGQFLNADARLPAGISSKFRRDYAAKVQIIGGAGDKVRSLSKFAANG